MPVKVRGVNWFGMNYERRWSKLIGMYKQDADGQNLVRSTEQSASSFSSSKSTRFHVLPNPVKLNSWCVANTPASVAEERYLGARSQLQRGWREDDAAGAMINSCGRYNQHWDSRQQESVQHPQQSIAVIRRRYNISLDLLEGFLPLQRTTLPALS